MKKKILKKRQEINDRLFDIWEKSFEDLSLYEHSNIMREAQLLVAQIELLDELLEDEGCHRGTIKHQIIIKEVHDDAW